MRNPKLRNIRPSVTHMAYPGKYGSATESDSSISDLISVLASKPIKSVSEFKPPHICREGADNQ
jgi:hypothetical protein